MSAEFVEIISHFVFVGSVRITMASNNVLKQLLNVLGGSFSFAEKEQNLSLSREECAQMIYVERKKAVDGLVFSLSVWQFAKLQFPNSQKSRCLNYFSVR